MELENIIDCASESNTIIITPNIVKNVCKGISLSLYSLNGLNNFFISNNDDVIFFKFVKDIFKLDVKKICYDIRFIKKLNIPFDITYNVYDIKLIYNDGTIFDLTKKYLNKCDIENIRQHIDRYDANIRACKSAKINVENYNPIDLMPKKFVVNYNRIKNEILYLLFNKCDEEKIQNYVFDVYDVACALYCIETNGIKINMDILNNNGTVSEKVFYKNVKKNVVNEFLYTKFNPAGSKTNRITTEKGAFNCMNIPKGISRDVIISRFNNGKIFTFDYNAIDYRSIIDSIQDDSFRKLYDKCKDFHLRTSEILFDKTNDKLRKIVKQLVYLHFYGGSIKSGMIETGLSSVNVKNIMSKMDKKLYPIKQFKNTFSSDSEFGIFAQTKSANIFKQGILSLNNYICEKKSKILFTVYDEVVIDVHSDEFDEVNNMKLALENVSDVMKNNSKLVVNVKSGRTYGQQH